MGVMIQTSTCSIWPSTFLHLLLLRNLPYVQQIHVFNYLQGVIQKASFRCFGLKTHQFGYGQRKKEDGIPAHAQQRSTIQRLRFQGTEMKGATPMMENWSNQVTLALSLGSWGDSYVIKHLFKTLENRRNVSYFMQRCNISLLAC